MEIYVVYGPGTVLTSSIFIQLFLLKITVDLKVLVMLQFLIIPSVYKVRNRTFQNWNPQSQKNYNKRKEHEFKTYSLNIIFMMKDIFKQSLWRKKKAKNTLDFILPKALYWYIWYGYTQTILTAAGLNQNNRYTKRAFISKGSIHHLL